MVSRLAAWGRGRAGDALTIKAPLADMEVLSPDGQVLSVGGGGHPHRLYLSRHGEGRVHDSTPPGRQSLCSRVERGGHLEEGEGGTQVMHGYPLSNGCEERKG